MKIHYGEPRERHGVPEYQPVGDGLYGLLGAVCISASCVLMVAGLWWLVRELLD